MTDHDWHEPPGLLARFATDPRAIDDPTASSIEAHLVTCADCRRRLAEVADPALARTSWDALADRIDRPRPVLVEWLLRRLGIDSATARLLTATPTLQVAGLAAIATLAVTATVLSRLAGAEGPFLVIAPLAPLATVAATLAPTTEPGGEAVVGTPLHGAGLLLRRAVTVLVVTFGVLGVAALALPDLGLAAAAWVLPALALALGALALGTWLRVEAAVGVLTGAWLLAVGSVWWFGAPDLSVADTATFTGTGQATALAVAAIATATVAARRERYATLEAFR